jgi:DNA-binding MarR family transcriptional regulator
MQPSSPDADLDAGPDAGLDADPDAGLDAGSDAGEAAVQALMLASRAFVGLTARSLAAVEGEGEVTLPQFRALVVLAVRGPQRSIDIAEELQVNPSTGTRMLDRLIRKGLVRRGRSTADRRVVRVRLTPAGRDVVDQVLTRRRTDLERLVAATAELWQPAVTQALTAFAEAAGEVGEQDWWLGWSAHRADDEDEPDTAGGDATSA